MDFAYHEDDLGVGPDAVDALDEPGEAVLICLRRDVVVGVLVIGADIDDYEIGGRMLREVPGLCVLEVRCGVWSVAACVYTAFW